MDSRTFVTPMPVGVNDSLNLVFALADAEGVGSTARAAGLGAAVGAGVASLVAPDDTGLIAFGAMAGVFVALHYNH